jgi:hypothetical protein
MAFVYKLEREDGLPADPPTFTPARNHRGPHQGKLDHACRARAAAALDADLGVRVRERVAQPRSRLPDGRVLRR